MTCQLYQYYDLPSAKAGIQPKTEPTTEWQLYKAINIADVINQRPNNEYSTTFNSL